MMGDGRRVRDTVSGSWPGAVRPLRNNSATARTLYTVAHNSHDETYTKTYSYTGWAKKVIPLVQCNVMYERYHFFGPPCIPILSPITFSSFDSLLCSSITPSLFHSRFKTYVFQFHKSFPRSFTFSFRPAFMDYCSDRFF